MATVFFSNAKAFHLHCCLPSSSSSSSSSTSYYPTFTTVYNAQKHNARTYQLTATCKASANDSAAPSNVAVMMTTKRNLAISVSTTILLSQAGKGSLDANAAILEADDDEELLEKVKKDRKKRLERQGVINSSRRETAYLQDLIYKLSKVGQAIEKNDLSAASSVLGQSTDTEWVQKVNLAFKKLSSSPDEQTEVDTFNSSLSSLISSVRKNDIEASKIAFVASASALEKWTTLTGLVEQLKGL